MLKKITLLLLFCAFWNCGYTPLYLQENDLGKPIKLTKLNGDNKINKRILSYLGLKEEKNTNSGYTLILESTKKIEIISKNKRGNPSVYRSSIVVNFSLIDKEVIIKQNKFSSSFTYNSSKRKFNFSQYQKNIEKNFVNEISEKIFIFLKS